MYILDTCVLSNLRLKFPDQNITEWISQEEEALALTPASVFEIQRGITLIQESVPQKARELEEWLDDLLAQGLPYLEMNEKVARLHACMTCTPALKNLWLNGPNTKTPSLKQDLVIAATAIVYGATIATMNTKDFLCIHNHYQLPGLYNPQKRQWSIHPLYSESKKTRPEGRQGFWPQETPKPGP